MAMDHHHAAGHSVPVAMQRAAQKMSRVAHHLDPPGAHGAGGVVTAVALHDDRAPEQALPESGTGIPGDAQRAAGHSAAEEIQTPGAGVEREVIGPAPAVFGHVEQLADRRTPGQVRHRLACSLHRVEPGQFERPQATQIVWQRRRVTQPEHQSAHARISRRG
ncbi:hypothetical protein GALL_489590 [mine drainage metagenome]|uniref:Uncharacterized protein n=1 Tax=mine drainage metagenome TaxID=410659 RepID=A0A1J5PDZ2_9ZZZZ